MSPPNQLVEVIHTWSEVFMQRTMIDFRRFMEETNLSFPQISVLMQLKHHENCGVSDMGKRLGISNAAASQLVDRLVQKGYVARTEDPRDRRAKTLSLTPEGLALIERGMQARNAWLAGMAASLSEAQRAHIIEALTLLTEAARATIPAKDNPHPKE